MYDYSVLDTKWVDKHLITNASVKIWSEVKKKGTDNRSIIINIVFQ